MTEATSQKDRGTRRDNRRQAEMARRVKVRLQYGIDF